MGETDRQSVEGCPKNFFEKPLDKQYQICYNNYRKKEKRGNKYGCFNEIRVWFEIYWFGF